MSRGLLLDLWQMDELNSAADGCPLFWRRISYLVRNYPLPGSAKQHILSNLAIISSLYL